MRSAGLVLLLVALVMGAAACGSSTPEGGSESTQATVQTTDSGGAQAPDFSGVTLDGDEVSLSAYRGKPLVLAFMASW